MRFKRICYVTKHTSEEGYRNKLNVLEQFLDEAPGGESEHAVGQQV